MNESNSHILKNEIITKSIKNQTARGSLSFSKGEAFFLSVPTAEDADPDACPMAAGPTRR